MELEKFIDGCRGEMTALLSELVKCKSVRAEQGSGMPFGKEAKRALDVMLSKAEELGFSVKNVDGYCGCVDYLPDEADGIKLGILAHLDVVPEGEGWTMPAFELSEKDGKFYGRGVTDDKGPAVAALYALYAVKSLGIKLKSGVRLIFGTDEENGSSDIEYYLTKEKMPPMTFTPDAQYPLINCEKGMVRVEFSLPFPSGAIKSISGGQVINAVPSSARAVVNAEFSEKIKAAVSEHKNIVTEQQGDELVINFNGISAHASTPEGGINAVTGLLNALSKIDLSGQNEAINALCKLFPFGETNGASLRLDICDEISGGLTEVLSIIETKDEQLCCKMDIRFPICSSKQQIHERLSAAFEPYGISIISYTGVEPHYTDSDSELVKALLSVYEEFYGKKAECIAIGGGTYVHEIDGGVAFGPEHDGTDYKIHGADEFLPINEFTENAVIFAKSMIKLCAQEEDSQ